MQGPAKIYSRNRSVSGSTNQPFSQSSFVFYRGWSRCPIPAVSGISTVEQTAADTNIHRLLRNVRPGKYPRDSQVSRPRPEGFKLGLPPENSDHLDCEIKENSLSSNETTFSKLVTRTAKWTRTRVTKEATATGNAAMRGRGCDGHD